MNSRRSSLFSSDFWLGHESLIRSDDNNDNDDTSSKYLSDSKTDDFVEFLANWRIEHSSSWTEPRSEYVMFPSDYMFDPTRARTRETSHTVGKEASAYDDNMVAVGEQVSDTVYGGLSEQESRTNTGFYSVVSNRSSTRTFHTTMSWQTTSTRNSAASHAAIPLTPWQEKLHEKNLIPKKDEEINWSGRGQHVEFNADEASKIDNLLVPKGVLGHSATALVEKVQCKRVMLARKKIKCNFRLKRDDAIEEVAHLQRLSHAHIVRGVGTYTYKNELSILLYPATPYNLETFLELYEESRYFTRSLISKANGIIEFFACLSNTMSFVHGHLVKHMDIKPRNLLIKETRWEQGHRYKIYLADFGIARSYNTIDDVETDSLTHFSRIYAAPEVVRQDMRGFAADIFSLGCVFLEMVAALARKRDVLLDIRKQNLSGDDSYQANLPTLQEITLEMSRDDAWVPCTLDDYNPMIKAMLNYDPDLRPTAVDLKSYLNTDTWCCSQGQEPFEADMPFNTPIMESLSE